MKMDNYTSLFIEKTIFLLNQTLDIQEKIPGFISYKESMNDFIGIDNQIILLMLRQTQEKERNMQIPSANKENITITINNKQVNEQVNDLSKQINQFAVDIKKNKPAWYRSNKKIELKFLIDKFCEQGEITRPSINIFSRHAKGILFSKRLQTKPLKVILI